MLTPLAPHAAGSATWGMPPLPSDPPFSPPLMRGAPWLVPFRLSFRVVIGHGADPSRLAGGEGFSFSYGDLPDGDAALAASATGGSDLSFYGGSSAAADGTPTSGNLRSASNGELNGGGGAIGELGGGSGLRVSLLTRRRLITVSYDGAAVLSVPMDGGLAETIRRSYGSNSPFGVELQHRRKGLTLRVANRTLLADAHVAGWAPRPHWRFGVGARNHHSYASTPPFQVVMSLHVGAYTPSPRLPTGTSFMPSTTCASSAAPRSTPWRYPSR